MTRIVAFVAVLASLAAGIGMAQDAPLGPGDRGPRFLVTGAGGQRVPVDAGAVPVLAARITLNLERVTRKQALQEIARQAGLRLVYGDAALHLDEPIRIRADGITVAAALTDVLWDAGLDVVFSANRHAALVRRPKGAALPQAGTITGHVTDAKTGDALTGTEVFLEGTRWRAVTAQDGRYRLAEVTPGSYTLVARRVGYGKQSRAIAVAEGAEVTVDIALQPVATQLNEIVTTVTGEQRRVELGHVVGRINADSLVKEAPVSSLSELLTARVPGLQVFQAQGTVGGRVVPRIRGPNFFGSRNEPIVIVDGVRYTTEERSALMNNNGPGDVEPSSPLNDLNVNDIESIEVVKGPSAATLYGTDAANGVIVVTTKRGRPGPARWNAHAKGTMTGVPEQHFPDIYWGWGTVSGVPNNPALSCTLARLASGQCTQQDSVTVLPNPLNDPQYTIFGSKPLWEYGVNVAGGRQDLRYYFSGDYEDATGPVHMPPAIAERLKEQRGLSELPEEWREPNAFTKVNFRSNVTAVLGDRADLRVATGYVKTANRTLSRSNNSYWAAQFSVTPTGLESPYGIGRVDPAQAFAQTTTERTDRFFGSASSEWRPAPWLATHALLGLDLTSAQRYGLVRPGDQPNGSFPSGWAEDTRSRQVATTADLGATLTLRYGRMSARTALGTQYVRTLYTASGSFGQGLPPGGAVVQRATSIFSVQRYQETVVLGGYMEEMLGLNDRLFLTGALRFDGASTFGRDYKAAVYPKIGGSWLLSQEPFLPQLPGLDELRLRYAFGASGKQPNPEVARPGFGLSQMQLNGQVLNTVGLTYLGNPNIRPQRVREREFGFDVSVFGNRLGLEGTWFRRRTIDQIALVPASPGLGFLFANLGLTTQRGFEAQVKTRVVDARLLSWDLVLQHSDNTTTLVDIGTGSMSRTPSGGWVEGYPLGARFQVPVVGWNDLNGDGVIGRNEVQRGDTAVYVGQSIPPRSQTLTTVLGLFERRLRLSALLERKSGFTQVNVLWCGLGTACRAAVDRSTPFEEQVKAMSRTGVVPEKGDFTRLREVTVALDLPASLMRAVRLNSATVIVSARNLALWTEFSGPDPEVGASDAATLSALGGFVASGIPHSRTFSVRVDLGF